LTASGPERALYPAARSQYRQNARPKSGFDGFKRCQLTTNR